MANQKKKQSFAEDARPRFGAVVGLLLLAGVMLAGTSCSSSSTSSANSLTSDQRAALNEAAEAFDNAESSLANSLEATNTVPKFEHWQEAETLHQQALKALRDGLPSGACRSSVEALLVIEDGQNVIRLRLIENYRQEKFGLVAEDTKDYGLSVLNGARQAEAAVGTACGRSSVDSAANPSNPTILNGDQNALFDAVVAAYDATGVAFDEALPLTDFVADVEAAKVLEVEVGKELDEAITLLGDGPCRTSVIELRAIERQQEELREAIISAGKSGNTVAMFTKLGEYSAVNSTSVAFTTARESVVTNCGFDI
ncbi:MAG: hypothetical protein F2520_04705 [Actinobacteria bacterium]|uniref:Unannotated protein n=1 Tax=freshwater metagenome TaxID=449393 RepID=A0A6J5YHV5_9ZZZZ|nr:hypothetical protein [Actinomycetota bacterium]MTA77542.1 hypothetical protein [Actinomycetota bacterium]